MRKITWEEMKEKAKDFYQEHKEACLFVGGILAKTAWDILTESPEPKSTGTSVDWVINKNGVDISGKNCYKKGDGPVIFQHHLDPFQAVPLANEILEELVVKK